MCTRGWFVIYKEFMDEIKTNLMMMILYNLVFLLLLGDFTIDIEQASLIRNETLCQWSGLMNKNQFISEELYSVHGLLHLMKTDLVSKRL
jgi:hypothetical protein